MGFISGTCLRVSSGQNLTTESCSDVFDGCPKKHYKIIDFYKCKIMKTMLKNLLHPIIYCQWFQNIILFLICNLCLDPVCQNVSMHSSFPIRNKSNDLVKLVPYIFGGILIFISFAVVGFVLWKERKKLGLYFK